MPVCPILTQRLQPTEKQRKLATAYTPMNPAATVSQSVSNARKRRPVFSPQFGQAYATIEARPGDGENDDDNTAQTIELMREMAALDSTNPAVIEATRQAIGDETRPAEKAARIFGFIKTRVEFQEDALTAALAGLPRPGDAEVLIRPADILRMPRPAGDCDDFTMLAVSMMTAAQVPARITAIEQDAERPGYFSHVFAEAFINGTWTPFDASHGDYLGWSARPTGKVKSWAAAMKGQTMQQSNMHGWEDLLNKGIDITGRILVPRLAVPQTPGGFYSGPGVTAGNNPIGGGFTLPGGFTGNTIGDSGNTALLIGAVGIIGLIFLLKR